MIDFVEIAYSGTKTDTLQGHQYGIMDPQKRNGDGRRPDCGFKILFPGRVPASILQRLLRRRKSILGEFGGPLKLLAIRLDQNVATSQVERTSRDSHSDGFQPPFSFRPSGTRPAI